MFSSRFHGLDELIRSETAQLERLDNTPPPDLLPNLQLLAQGLDAVVDLLGHRLEISSGYRCPALNERVGGAPASQHVLGLAADFTCEAYGPPAAVALAIVRSAIAFDQCILEYDRWVHLSFSPHPRRRTLTIYTPGEYLDGLVDPDGRRMV